MRRSSFIFLFFIVGLISAISASGVSAQSRPLVKPTPTPDEEAEKIFTEEVRMNISAFDAKGKFAADIKKEDLIISEDGRLHQADSLRSVPANVLILIDTGGEERRIKGQGATRRVAKSMVDSLKAEDSIAIIEYNDKINVLAEWTSDKAELNGILDKKMGFGKRSRMTEAFDLARIFMERAPLENRHIVLITDGIDSMGDPQKRAEAIKNLLTTNINVHVLSYTLMERKDLPAGGVLQKGGGTSKSIPEEVLITLPGPVQDTARMPRIATVNLDREMMRKYKKRAEDLKKSEAELTQLAEDTNGEIFLPVNTTEMQEKTGVLAKNIDSQYTLTYTPKRSLNDVETDEVRNIEVTSRRPGVTVQGKRKLVVRKHKVS